MAEWNSFNRRMQSVVLFILTLHYAACQDGSNNETIPEKFKAIATVGDNVLITCSFSLIKWSPTPTDDELYDDNGGGDKPNSPYEIDIYWILPHNDDETHINGSHIREEKVFYNKSIHSILSVSAVRRPHDQGYYVCLFYRNRALLSQKQIYLLVEDPPSKDTFADGAEQPRNQTEDGSTLDDSPADGNTTAIIVSSVIVLLAVIAALALFLLYKQKRKNSAPSQATQVRYDRNSSVRSDMDLVSHEIRLN